MNCTIDSELSKNKKNVRDLHIPPFALTEIFGKESKNESFCHTCICRRQTPKKLWYPRLSLDYPPVEDPLLLKL